LTISKKKNTKSYPWKQKKGPNMAVFFFYKKKALGHQFLGADNALAL
jgi:hypothetical protein